MVIQKDYPLKTFNSFHVEANAKYYVEICSVGEAREIFIDKKYHKLKKIVLGGGSNVLFTKDFNGLVIKNSIPGITVINEDDHNVIIEAGAGVKWDDLVRYCVDKNLGGIENLSLIPGSVGAAPIQNIGAYGQELKDSFFELTGIFIESGEQKVFQNADCDFLYRSSIFKESLRNKFIITSVKLKLNKHPEVNLSYKQVEEEIIKHKITNPSISDVRKIVIGIRSSKLPDPMEIGNAGSFFKNPVLDIDLFNSIKSKYPELKSFPDGDERVKISAAWLIENCGWKEKRFGDAGVHHKQSLVLVNYGSASGKEIYELSQNIRKSVADKFGIELENEVNII